jgi:hypothetical protein
MELQGIVFYLNKTIMEKKGKKKNGEKNGRSVKEETPQSIQKNNKSGRFIIYVSRHCWE